MACQNLGLLKSTKVLGQHRIRILAFNTCQNLGLFHTNLVSWCQKTHGLLLLVKTLGFSKSAKILSLHCIKVPGLTPVEILGYFWRTRLLTLKTHCLCGLSKCWVFLREQRYAPTSYPNPSYNTRQNLGLFHKKHVFWRQKPVAYFTCQNLGIFNEYRDFGPMLYQNVR